MAEPLSKSAIQDELKRVRAKKSASDDQDIRQALQLRVEALEATLAKLEAQEQTPQAAEEPKNLEPATPEQLRKADELVRQARVEKMRNNKTQALTLMKEAAAIAPTAPSVLEALGDDYTERKAWKDAKEAYSQALQFAKHNVELERKHASAVLRAKGMGSYDATLRMEGGDPLFLTSQDSLANLTVARLLNLLVPGLGHIVVGKTVAGICLIVVDVCFIVWLALMHKDVELIPRMLFGKGSPNPMVFLPLFGMVVTIIIALTSLGEGPVQKKSTLMVHPQPPMDLPFE